MTSIADTVDNGINNSLDGKVDLLTEFMVRGAQATGLTGVLFGVSEALTSGIDEISSLFALGGVALGAVAQAYRNWYAEIGPITYETSERRASSVRSAYGNSPSHADMLSAYGGKSCVEPQRAVRQYSPASVVTKRRATTSYSYADLVNNAPSKRAARAATYANVAPSSSTKPALLAAVDSYAKQREADAAHEKGLQMMEELEADRNTYSNRGIGEFARPRSMSERVAALEESGGVHGHSLEFSTGTYLPVRPKRHEHQQKDHAA